MAVPSPAIPSTNAYTVHVAFALQGPLVDFARAAAPLLKPWKIPVRMHVSGDSPAIAALRETLAQAGARASGFSPAPSPGVPGEGFWKTTIVVVETDDAENFLAREREDRKVGWDPLVIALRRGSCEGLAPAALSAADLWVAEAPGDAAAARDAWMRAGSGSVAVVAPDEIAWESRNAVFGRSSGIVAADGEAAANTAEAGLGHAAARIVAALLRELLSENLFDKTLVRADRECLEMRPLRLGRACGAPWSPSRPWGSFGRKERHESRA